MNKKKEEYKNLLAQALETPEKPAVHLKNQYKALDKYPNIAGYQIEKTLGRGGMGTVYKALDLKLQRAVAVKVFSPQFTEPFYEERFYQESTILAKINHPHIVSIYAIIEKQPLSLILEYLPGGDLAQRIANNGVLSLFETCKIGSEICSGLSALHAENIVHRDLKPANILLTETGRAKISDLGIAKQQESYTMTMTGTYLGSFAYTAPEQLQGRRDELDHRADIWSMGVLLFELLVSKPPELDLSGNVLKQVPVCIRPIIKRCLEKNVADRYPSALALQADLEKIKCKILKKAWYKKPITLISLASIALLMSVLFFYQKKPKKAVNNLTSESTKNKQLQNQTPNPIPATQKTSLVTEQKIAQSEAEQKEVKKEKAENEARNKVPIEKTSLSLLQTLKTPLQPDAGTWQLNGKILRCLEQEGPAVLSFPLQSIGKNYDLSMEICRETGKSGAVVYLPSSIGNVTFDLDGWNRGLSGIQNLNRQNLKQHDQRFLFKMQNGVFYKLNIQVTTTEISIFINGKQRHTCSLIGKRGSILHLWQMPRKGLISVGAYSSGMAFKNIKLNLEKK